MNYDTYAARLTGTTLPTDSEARKEYAIGRGCLAYFPAAIAGVARHSFKAGAKHTGGELVHKRFLSGDHEDCIERHLMDLRDLIAAKERSGLYGGAYAVGAILDEADAIAWRALALSQELHEKYGGAPLAPAARVEPELSTIAKQNRADLERSIQAYAGEAPLEEAVNGVSIG